MRTLLWLGVILLVIWVLAGLVFELAGFLMQLLLLVGIVMLVLWAVGRLRSGT